MFVQLLNIELDTIPELYTFQWIRSTKRQPRNFPKVDYSSTATLGKGPDLRQRNWRNLASSKSTTLLERIKDYSEFFFLLGFGKAYIDKIVSGTPITQTPARNIIKNLASALLEALDIYNTLRNLFMFKMLNSNIFRSVM
jgi:hypothetical protein